MLCHGILAVNRPVFPCNMALRPVPKNILPNRPLNDRCTSDPGFLLQ